MTLADLGKRIKAAWHALRGHIHFELEGGLEQKMALPPEVIDALAAIKNAIMHAVDATKAAADQKAADDATITGLQGQVSDLQSQLSACQAADAAKDAEIASLQADLNDLQSQVTALAAQLNPPAAGPTPIDPVPADPNVPAVDPSGAGVSDPTP